MSTKFATRLLVTWCAVGLLLLTACGGGEEPSRTLDLDGEGAESAAPEAGNEPSEAPDEPREGELTRSANAASTPEEEAVAEAWFTYMEEFVRVVGTPDPSGFRLMDLAQGRALGDSLAYAGDLAADGHRLGGGMIATVLGVEVMDRKAVVRGCLRSTMVEVDAQDAPVAEMKNPWIESEHELSMAGDGWIVVEHEMEGAPKCV